MSRQESRRRVIGTFVLGLFVFIVCEGWLFRVFYPAYLKPDSYAGSFELLVRHELEQDRKGQRTVVVVGDSRIAEGLSAKSADKSLGGELKVVNAALRGSTPRVWHYLLREIDPSADRYGCIALPVTDFEDVDEFQNFADRVLDLRPLLPRLGFFDIIPFARSFDSRGLQRQVAWSLLLKGLGFKEDVQDLLDDFSDRLEEVEQNRKHGREWKYNYAGRDGSLAGLTFDPDARTVDFPAHIDPEIRDRLRRFFARPPAPQNGTMSRYRRRWFGAIADRYRDSETKLLFFQLPRHPIVPFPDSPESGESVVRELSRQKQALLLDERTFQFLEKPEFFFDELHLNRVGREAFTRVFAENVDELLARISHHSPAAAPDSGMSAALLLLGPLDGLHEYACAGLRRAPCSHATLHRLATKSDEKCGLAGATVANFEGSTPRD